MLHEVAGWRGKSASPLSSSRTDLFTEPESAQTDEDDGEIGSQASDSDATNEGTSPFQGGRKSVRTLSKSNSFLKIMKSMMTRAVDYVRGLFSFPLVREPITFCRPDDFTATGEFDPNHIRRQRVEGTGAEILNRYDKATKEIFENILKERKQALESKDKYHYQPVNLSKYPPWTEHVIEGLRKSFQVFDVDLSGRIEFEELCKVLNGFGNKTPMEERRRQFDAMDINRSGAIDFEEFIGMTYALTVKPVDENEAQLAVTYKRTDCNMARILSLDVVQQLQSGLF